MREMENEESSERGNVCGSARNREMGDERVIKECIRSVWMSETDDEKELKKEMLEIRVWMRKMENEEE